MRKSEGTARRVPTDMAATEEEIIAAAECLSADERRRLERYARKRVDYVGRARLGRNWEDLVQQAVEVTLSGQRSWNKNAANFAQHLIGAMRSMSTHWREQFHQNEPYLESEVVTVASDGTTSNPVRNLAAAAPTIQQILEFKEEIERIDRLICDHPYAMLIVNGLAEGLTGPEIITILEITRTEYETTMKWVRRKVRANTSKGETND